MYNPVAAFMKNCSYLSLSKLGNLLWLKKNYFFNEASFNNALPAFISVEPAGFCQLRCPECPVGRSFHQRGHAILNKSMYEKLVDELKTTLLHIIFYFQGEPLLNKELPALIKYAHSSGIYTSTSTNAQALNEGYARALVESGLDKLIISIDGTTQDTYEAYRAGGSLKKTLKGIEHIVEWKKKLKSAAPLVELQFLVLKTNEHQMKEMKLLARKLEADKLTFKTAQLYDFENGHELMPAQQKYSRYRKNKDGKYMLKAKQPNRCWRLWSGAVVSASGEVLPCCFDKQQAYSFGSIREKSFAACWHSSQAAAFRGSILQNRKQIDICRNCSSSK